MYGENLLERCTQLYGEEIGDKLSLAMLQIAHKDFCVATGLDARHVSISRNCFSRGRAFRLSEDYTKLIMPDGSEREISSLSYKDIVPFLQRNSINPSSHNNCFMDDPVRCNFDMSSLC